MNDLPYSFSELISYRENLTNVLNGRRQSLAVAIGDKRFLEILAHKDPKKKVQDDAGIPIDVQTRITQIVGAIDNLRDRIRSTQELLALSDEELTKRMEPSA